MSIEYNEYLTKHIKNVIEGLRWISDYLDLKPDERFAISECFYRNHDQSKYETVEYAPYDIYFYGGNKTYRVVQDFNYAWLHHIHNNKHHWQYWVLINDDEKDGTIALEMPKTYVMEMIADWWSFSWMNDDLGSIFKWYDSHKDRMILHENTRKLVEDILDQMRNKLVELGKIKETEEVVEHSDIDENEDDEHKYGVPEIKKFPMPDADHVRSAIRFFNYIDPRYEKELAKAILGRAEEYGVNLSDMNISDENRFKKYVPEENENEK